LPQGSPGKLNDSEVRCGTQLITLSVRGEYQTLLTVLRASWPCWLRD
jgi:hypothetical protein